MTWLLIVLLPLLLIALRVMGRRWYCQCGWRPLLYRGPQAGLHYSQHLLDAWSVTHLGHGVFFYGTLHGFMTTWPSSTAIAATLVLEGLWELLENTPWAIAAYRKSGDIQYEGDSVLNVAGDLLCCGVAAWATSWFV